MAPFINTFATQEDVIAVHGPWSAMGIDLPDGSNTRLLEPDHRLRRILQLAADTLHKPLSECRVLDLACLEGHYAIEFALQGAEAVGIEIREANIAKAAFAADKLGLENIAFYQDDVRNLSPETYGQFDIIICSGILYHLTGPDAAGLIHAMRACCSGILLLDTYIATRQDLESEYGGKTYGGTLYIEHETGASDADKSRDLWASIDNETSFWFHRPALFELIWDAGFTSAAEVALPAHPGTSYDRRTFLCVAGTPVQVKSSVATQNAPMVRDPIPDPSNLHPSQIQHGAAFSMAKKYLPQGLKEVIKPVHAALTGRKLQRSPFEKQK